jgi:hypothetical protein
VLILAAALVFVWARVVHTLTERIVPRPPIGEPQAIVWDTRVFTTDRQLKAFLDAKGISYAGWVSRHPAAFALIRHELPASAVGERRSIRRSTAGRRAQHPVRHTARAHTRPRREASPPVVTSAPAPSTAFGGEVLTGAIVAIGIALGASAILPVAIAPRLLGRIYRIPERRLIAFAAAAALLVGVALASFGL